MGNEEEGLREVIVRLGMSLYRALKTKVRVGSELSEEYMMRVGVHQGSVLSLLLFAIMMDVITENGREGLM